MSTSTVETTVRATKVAVTDDSLVVELEDGRTIITPLLWYPRLLHGSKRERKKFEIGIFGIHWPDLDEDLSISGMLAGHMSIESRVSLHRWLEGRKAQVTNPKRKSRP